jgi:hypothetical protein
MSIRSFFLKLGVRDFIHGLVIAILSAIGTFLAGELSAGTVVDIVLFKRCGLAALIGFVSYLVKNLFQNSKGDLGPEPKPPVT